MSAERSTIVVHASEGMSYETAFFAAVERAVRASLEIENRHIFEVEPAAADVMEALPVVVVKGESWAVEFDAFGEFTREQRAMIGIAIAAAYRERRWLSVATCARIDDARVRGAAGGPQSFVYDQHANAVHAFIKHYIDTVRDNPAAGVVQVLSAGLRETGQRGGELAIDDEQAAAADPLPIWFDPAEPGLCHYPLLLADALWHDLVQPQLEREAKNNANPAALTLGNFDTVNRLMWHKNHSVAADNRQPELFVDDRLIATARVPDFALIDVLTAGTAEFRSYAGARMFVWVVEEVKRRHFMGVQYPNVLTIEGGLGALAESIGVGGSKSREALLRRILIAGQSWRVEWPDGREQGGLWTFSISPASRAARACVTITVSAPLTPYYDQRSILTPIVPIDDLDGITSKNYLGPLAAFKQSIMRELVEQRLEIAAHGGALITERRLLSLAALVGLPAAAAIRAFNAWQIDRDEGERFLEVHRGRVHIAAGGEYQRIRDFVDATANIAKTASSRGKKSAAKKRKK